MTTHIRTTCCGLVVGSLLLLAAGCGSSPEEGYQTLSTEEAEQIEQARRERAQAEAEETADAAAETELSQRSTSDAPVEDLSASPLVLAAAQTAASTVFTTNKQADQSQTDPTAPADATSDPWAVSPPVETEPAAASPPATPADTEADSPIEVAASRAASAVQGEPVEREIQLLIPDRSFTIEGPDDAIRISFDDFDLLKVLNMEPVPVDAVDHFPEWLKDLDGKRVRVRGFMFPTFQETDLPGFVLARDNQICCFGRNPKIYDLVDVTLAPGVTTDYIQGRPFDVVGQFHIRPEADGGELWQLYQMTDAIVIDK